MRYYFNIKDGTTMHDDEGMEFDDINAVERGSAEVQRRYAQGPFG